MLAGEVLAEASYICWCIFADWTCSLLLGCSNVGGRSTGRSQLYAPSLVVLNPSVCITSKAPSTSCLDSSSCLVLCSSQNLATRLCAGCTRGNKEAVLLTHIAQRNKGAVLLTHIARRHKVAVQLTHIAEINKGAVLLTHITQRNKGAALLTHIARINKGWRCIMIILSSSFNILYLDAVVARFRRGART